MCACVIDSYVMFQIVMEYCGAGSVADIMRLRNKCVCTSHFCCLLSLKWRDCNNIYTPTARPTMNSFVPNDVQSQMNAVSLEFLYLSCNDVCDWSSELNGLKT